jgi:MerR family mercuric resistance operon transcriptional regulator
MYTVQTHRRSLETPVEEQVLRIGEVAGEAGVNVQTLRFYERRGLLKTPSRRPSGYREYTTDSVRRVRFIKRAQQLGFTLNEVQELLRLRDDPSVPCPEVRATAQAKVGEIDEKIRHLRAMKKALETLARSCADNREHRCPLLEALDDAQPRRTT